DLAAPAGAEASGDGIIGVVAPAEIAELAEHPKLAVHARRLALHAGIVDGGGAANLDVRGIDSFQKGGFVAGIGSRLEVIVIVTAGMKRGESPVFVRSDDFDFPAASQQPHHRFPAGGRATGQSGPRYCRLWNGGRENAGDVLLEDLELLYLQAFIEQID